MHAPVYVHVQCDHALTARLCVLLSNGGGLSLQTCPGARQYLTKHNEQLGRKREINQKKGCKCITKCCKTAAVIKIYSHFTSPMTTELLPCLHCTEQAIKTQKLRM